MEAEIHGDIKQRLALSVFFIRQLILFKFKGFVRGEERHFRHVPIIAAFEIFLTEIFRRVPLLKQRGSPIRFALFCPRRRGHRFVAPNPPMTLLPKLSMLCA